MIDETSSFILFVAPVYIGSCYGEFEVRDVCLCADLLDIGELVKIEGTFAARDEDHAIEAIGAVASALCERRDVGVIIDGDTSVGFVEVLHPTREEAFTGVVLVSERLVTLLPSFRQIIPDLIDQPEEGRFFYLDPFELSYRTACFLNGEDPD